MKTWDLIVIGAGPAGSACASLCAKAGKSVLLLEAARFPRDKVCGDCLNPAVWPVIERLGLRTRIDALPSSTPKHPLRSISSSSSHTPLSSSGTSP